MVGLASYASSSRWFRAKFAFEEDSHGTESSLYLETNINHRISLCQREEIIKARSGKKVREVSPASYVRLQPYSSPVQQRSYSLQFRRFPRYHHYEELRRSL